MTEPVLPDADGPVACYEPPAPTATAPAPSATPVSPGVPPIAGAPPLASVIAKPVSSSGRGTSLLLLLAGAVAVGGLAFAGGRLTAPATASTGQLGTGQLPGGQLPGNGQGFTGRGDGFGGVSLSGTVSAVSADSITVTLASGTSISIPLDGDTEYHVATAATAGDVTVGSDVRVTPGVRVPGPGASLDPNASPGPGAAGISFGPATDVTLVEP